MATQSDFGWTLPDSSDTPDGPAQMATLADDIADSLKLIETGTVTTGPSSAASFTTAVTFTNTFSAPPHVLINLPSGSGTTAKWHGRAISITTTGFTLFGFGDSSTTFSAAWWWVAVGRP